MIYAHISHSCHTDPSAKCTIKGFSEVSGENLLHTMQVYVLNLIIYHIIVYMCLDCFGLLQDWQGFELDGKMFRFWCWSALFWHLILLMGFYFFQNGILGYCLSSNFCAQCVPWIVNRVIVLETFVHFFFQESCARWNFWLWFFAMVVSGGEVEAGATMLSGMTVGLNGQIPHLQNVW